MKLSEETERVLPETPEEADKLVRLEFQFEEIVALEGVCWRKLSHLEKQKDSTWEKFAALFGKTREEVGTYTFTHGHFHTGLLQYEGENKHFGDNASLSLRGMKIKREALTEMIITLEEEIEKNEKE